MFNECFINNYTITYDSRSTERKLSFDGNELQVDIASAQRINSPKYLIGGFQTEARVGTLNKNINIPIFDNVNVRNIFVKWMVLDIQMMLFSQIFLKMII